MANVRIDQNGIPKGVVYEWTTPAVHRSSVTAVDSSDPEDTSGAVNCDGYQYCRLDITISGSGFSSLDVQALFWNSRQSAWFGGAKRQFTETGQHSILVEARGGIIFLKVVAFSGTSFSLDADCALG